MAERKLRWNRFTDSGEQVALRYRYVFAIINEPREIGRIKQRFLEQMSPVDEVIDICDFPIPSSGGLHSFAFALSSGRATIENPNKIYANLRQFRRDRDLFERDEESMLAYLDRLVK